MIQNHGNAMIKNVLIHSYYRIFIQICILIYCFASFLGTNVFWRIFVMKFINCLKALFWGGSMNLNGTVFTVVRSQTQVRSHTLKVVIEPTIISKRNSFALFWVCINLSGKLKAAD